MKSLFKPVSEWLLGESNTQAVKEKEIQKGYADPLPSFADQFAVVDFNEQEQVFCLPMGKASVLDLN